VTQWAAADEMGTTFSGLVPGGSTSPAPRSPDVARQEAGTPSGWPDGSARGAVALAAGSAGVGRHPASTHRRDRRKQAVL